MYQKILVPLNRSSKESERTIAIAKDFLAPEGEGILLDIVPPGVALTVGLFTVPAFQVEQEDYSKAMANVGFLADRLNQVSGRWRTKVIVSNSMSGTSVDLAISEEVDAIAIYAHHGNDRTELAKLIETSLDQKFPQSSPIEVRVVNTRELATA